MIARLKSLICLVIFFATAQVLSAADYNSQAIAKPQDGQNEIFTVVAVARCICDASMRVSSSSGKVGQVLNSQKVDSITFLIDKKEVTLKSPPQGIRAYYAGAAMNPWVKDELAKKGVNLSAHPDVRLVSFTGTVVLFKDVNAKEKL